MGPVNEQGSPPANEPPPSNRLDYQRTRYRFILRADELRPTTIIELIDCLGSLDLHPADHRVERLQQLYPDITGEEPPQPK